MRVALDELLAMAESLPVANLPVFLGGLETARCVALSRLMAPAAAATNNDELLDVTEAARRLNCSESYLYRHWRSYPFTRREGKKLLFSAKGIERYIQDGTVLTARRQHGIIGSGGSIREAHTRNRHDQNHDSRPSRVVEPGATSRH